MQDLVRYLKEGNLLIADGATGTMLQAMGLPPGLAPELWNVERPDAIRAHYRAYLNAGSEVILANTFGGNRIKLERTGRLGARVVELNRAGASLAVEEAAGEAYVAGDMGPTGELLAPYGTLQYGEAVEAYAEQALALVEGGVDLLWGETLTDLSEARALVEGVRQVTDLPLFCSLSFGRSGRTMMGVTPRQAAETLWPLGLTAIGTNCGEGIPPVAAALDEMRAALPDAVLIAKPNAGLPRLEDGQTVFPLGPEDMAAEVPDLVGRGAQVIGGCCGNTPAHIAAIADVVCELRRVS
ncbi:MAG TPA: homocysteine S-methyltransferase family protein [Anaerolineae bacterium]|nr:homocysteine S-methyltransferase family protein [Anaerolineae bacterium]